MYYSRPFERHAFFSVDHRFYVYDFTKNGPYGDTHARIMTKLSDMYVYNDIYLPSNCIQLRSRNLQVMPYLVKDTITCPYHNQIIFS